MCVSDWSILSDDWLIDKFDLLTPIWTAEGERWKRRGGGDARFKYFAHAFPDLYEKVKLIAKV